MISELYEHPYLLNYVNGGMTRTAAIFKKCGMPQEDAARSKHQGRPRSNAASLCVAMCGNETVLSLAKRASK